MSEPVRASSAPGASKLERASDLRESKTTHSSWNNDHIIPQELLVSLSSSVCSKNGLGQSAHHRTCQDFGVRRPDAVWHHSLGRKKYKYFLEQPTSLTGAGRDISFLCDTMVAERKTTPHLPPLKNNISDTQNKSILERLVPEEYRIVKNKGIQNLEFYEDAFTVQLKDNEKKLRVLPSLRPSGRLEAVQLSRMMDDMLEKAGVNQQNEELTELSQLEGLLELVKVEQNIYNIVFHELIRQVSVGCVERGQLLAKLRKNYQSLLSQIPHRLKALHTEVVAQRTLDRHLTDEIQRIKTSIQQLSMELSKIKDHDAFVSQQAEHAHRQLADSLKQTHCNSNVVQGYHELYEMQRSRLEAQLVQRTEERDDWVELTFCLARKVINRKKLQLVSRLHLSEQNWFKTAEHCVLYLVSKDTKDLNVVLELCDSWGRQLTDLMSRLRNAEEAQSGQIQSIQQGIGKWLSVYTTNKKGPDPKYDKGMVAQIHADLQQWSKILSLQCEFYQGESQFYSLQTLRQLHSILEEWLKISSRLFTRHSSPGGDLPEGHQLLKELDDDVSKLFKQLDTQVNGESGIHGNITRLAGLIESWVFTLDAVIEQTEEMSLSVSEKLEKALQDWQSLSEEALQHLTIREEQSVGQIDKSKQDVFFEAEKALDKVREFKTRLSNFTVEERQRLREEVNAVHMALTRWMLDLLLLMIPDLKDHDHELQPHDINQVPLQSLRERAKVLCKKLDNCSQYISSSCALIFEEQVFLNLGDDDRKNVINECEKLQTECADWVEISLLLLSGVVPVEVPVTQPEHISNTDHILCSTNATIEAQRTTDHETQEVALMVPENITVKQISSDGSITERKLDGTKVSLKGTDDLVVSPATEEAQKAFRDLTTVGLLQQELLDSEMRLKTAEQRALKAEEELQEALGKIQDLEKQLEDHPRLQAQRDEGMEKTETSPTPTVKSPAIQKKSSAESKPTSSTKRTKKR
ncbi:axonemal dynein light chain domain-containing protein 1 isoform X2 [Gouania willdenowi]|uniref:axonemal dynein light chain domain-containing protein 1 isoform X2 n=1 Tax=Gouania willdenowi TaxID=441366 RepID=UPI001055A798|nr:axonemal dynein light chain domain-containing protein 1 isoform X2 [Gouania willdenowi]